MIAAASDLRFAMDEIAAQFQEQHPEVEVKTIYGSSGHFLAQIQYGAPFDVFCSADMAYPRKLAEAGLTVPGSEFSYAVGRIAIWVPNESSIDVEKLGVESLLDPSIIHIAIADPGHAPYGKAAVEAMKTLGVYDSVKDKLAYGDNVSQTLQHIQARSADIGIVALSLTLAPVARGKGRYWEFPLDSYQRMEQGGVISKYSNNEPLSQAFRQFVQGSKSREILKGYGFYAPEGR